MPSEPFSKLPSSRARIAHLILAGDLAGTAVFGAEGARSAINTQLDLLGIAVLASATAFGGGILRDILLGDTPPRALRDPRYLFAAIAGAGAAILASRLLRPGNTLLVMDAAGLSLFAVVGTEKALAFGQRGFTCVLLGTLTAVGGGLMADILANRIPAILRTDFYASAALPGATTLVLLRRGGIGDRPAALCAGLVCFTLRICGATLHWHLPILPAG